MDSFTLHIAFMGAGFLTLICGVAVAMFMRKKRTWLKIHRALGITGAGFMIAGLIAGAIMVNSGSGGHFAKPHTWFGILSILCAAAAATLGFVQFQFRQMIQTLRDLHRWSGRFTLLISGVAILTGLILAEIL